MFPTYHCTMASSDTPKPKRIRSSRVRRSRKERIVYRWIAIVSAGLAFVGMMLPLMPGAVFAIISAWAASRSSPALNLKIRRNKYLGPVIHSWENGRTIPTWVKFFTLFLFCVSLSKLWWFEAPQWLFIGMVILFVGISTFMFSRPSPEAWARKQAAIAEAESRDASTKQQRPVEAEHKPQRQSAGQ